ncbi:HAD family hydrolase [Streptomyces sp. NBC_01637]|uniref:HAD family hydrolase n=1 Tax=unclassified Streptomyces TaxID=2593676 RepID=UPI0038708B28|nr:HAD-IA family hydrolase [Streptomyces sp. NBC_01653]WTD37653.1 HAD-IA family hydrolase [Streptomyces sp. NBC_01643]WTD93059.1 HAD-IA family hydrolase [Streptomyces sp. NBC_01637]
MTVSEISNRPFDVVLCDLDNVIRFYDMAPLAELERAAGLAEGTTVRVAYAPEIDLPLLLGKITKEEWVGSIASALSDRVPQTHARELGMALADAPIRADDVVVALLRRVRRHMPLVLVTNATLELESDLEAMGLADLADHVVSSARVGVAKPDRAIYEIATERAGAAANRCLFVDDRLENVKAAITLGMTGVHYKEPADLQEVLDFVLDG